MIRGLNEDYSDIISKKSKTNKNIESKEFDPKREFLNTSINKEQYRNSIFKRPQSIVSSQVSTSRYHTNI